MMKRLLVAVLLSGGIALSALALYPLPFSKSAVGYTGCDPSTITGLKLWLKADSLGLTDGTPVGTWTDSSGTSNSATAAGSARPLFKTSIINGLPALLFDGAATVMTFPNDPIIPTSTFVVSQTNIAASSALTYAAMIITSNASGIRICHRLTGTNWGTFVSGDLSSGEDLVSGTPNLLELTTLGSGSTNTVIYRNGVQKTFSANSDSGGAPACHIGAENSNRWFSGYMAEVIIYNTVLSTADRSCIEDYLSLKYGITVTH